MAINNSVLRILDANFNRAREALRVMEEYARFVLEDESLMSAIKGARHELKDISNFQFPISNLTDPADDQTLTANSSLMTARDTAGDVGTAVEGQGEYQRANVQEVVIAAGRRLSESLRVLEEYGKLPDIPGAEGSFAKRVERLRYRGYDLERRLAFTIRARQRFGDVKLYVILTEALCRTSWFGTAEAVIRGGVQCLQLREKHLPDVELLRRAKRLAALCRERGVIFIVNDRADIATAAHAHGVHLGQDDISASDARRVFDTNMLLGVSTHTVEQVESAIAAAPDYVAVGPMFPSETKPQPHIAGPELLSIAYSLTSLPLVAIGGINESNGGVVKSANSGCAICVCSAIISAPDPEAATRRFLDIAR